MKEVPHNGSPDPRELAALPAQEALTHLVDEQGGRIYRVAMKLCGHPEDAADLVQDVFLEAYRHWDQFRGDSQPTTWLYTIAARACQRARRKRSGEPKVVESLDDLLPGPQDRIPDLATVEEGPLAQQLRKETRERVEAAIAELPEHYRMPLVLKEILELPVSDVAQILDLKEATVKTRLHRARLMLRQAVADGLPQRSAPHPNHDRQVCLDLLTAKQEALDRGVPFRVPPDELCTRCEALFDTLDLTQNACRQLRQGEMPPQLRQEVVGSFSPAAGA
jgi:RNA polymerase sigma-70 factor (ECF subfamily)